MNKSPEIKNQASGVRRQGTAAFTLMELLVVLAIMALLMGLLFPALMGARERAWITRARTEVQAIQQAWMAYWTTYGQTKGWPLAGDVPMDGAAVAILAGTDTAANPLGIGFMEFNDEQLSNGFLDPWGKPYKVVLAAPTTEATDWAFTTRVHLVNTARYRY